MGNEKTPYKQFGLELKRLRSKAAKTPAEVSGAIEIDEIRLAKFENGELRPSEDILHLLLQHFDIQGSKAEELWKLAGYGSSQTPEQIFMQDDFGTAVEEVAMQLAAQDNRIVYTDMLQVMVNNYGVIMNFMQGAGTGNQPLAVARVGMSKEHARTVIDVLQRTLDEADKPSKPKQISPGNNASEKKR